MAVIRALKTEKGFIKSYKRAIKVDNKVLIANKNILRVVGVQIVKNGNFKTSSGWSLAGGTMSYDTNAGVITLTPNASGITNKKMEFYQMVANPILGHKYLVKFYYKASEDLSSSSNITYVSARTYFTKLEKNKWHELSKILHAYNSNGNYYDIYFFFSNEAGTVQVKRASSIDLTEAFGAGNEPTTVEEAEAKLGKDYIPYQYI